MRNGPYELVVAPASYPGKRYRGRYVYEHHLVWWQNTGQVVPEGFVVHHKNENKRDNRFRNLELKEFGKHSGEHSAARAKPPVSANCGWCGATFELPLRVFKTRIKQSVSGELFCSKSHQGLYQQCRRRSRGRAPLS